MLNKSSASGVKHTYMLLTTSQGSCKHSVRKSNQISWHSASCIRDTQCMLPSLLTFISDWSPVHLPQPLIPLFLDFEKLRFKLRSKFQICTKPCD